MKYVILCCMALALAVGIVVANPSFTDTAATDNYGKIGLKKLTADIDANFAIIEGGAFNQSYKPTTGAGVLTVTGNETNDASLVLDADDGDDNADTWTMKSATADNNLDFINHTTEAANLAADGTLSVLGGLDAIGAVDLDVGSADVTDVTVTTDGGTVILDGSVAASAKVTSYGYPAVVGHTNGSSQVYMTQSGSVVGNGSTTYTQTFDVVYIAVPNVVVTSSDAASATNAPYIGTIASNQFTVVTDGVGTNFQWISHGRLK